jgi:hypothetical protein
MLKVIKNVLALGKTACALLHYWVNWVLLVKYIFGSGDARTLWLVHTSLLSCHVSFASGSHLLNLPQNYVLPTGWSKHVALTLSK